MLPGVADECFLNHMDQAVSRTAERATEVSKRTSGRPAAEDSASVRSWSHGNAHQNEIIVSVSKVKTLVKRLGQAVESVEGKKAPSC